MQAGIGHNFDSLWTMTYQIAVSGQKAGQNEKAFLPLPPTDFSMNS